MASTIRSLALALKQTASSATSSSFQQIRSKHNIFSKDTTAFDFTTTRVPRDFYIDAWCWRREKLRHEFTFKDQSGKWQMLFAYLVVPTILFRNFTWAQHMADEDSGWPSRCIMFYEEPSETSFFYKYAEQL
jgi:hypothetical protein